MAGGKEGKLGGGGEVKDPAPSGEERERGLESC